MTDTTKKIHIRYKKKRNIRQFNLWDSALLNDMLQSSVLLKQKLEEEDKADAIMLDADMVYELAVAYIEMYNKLLKEQLLISGKDILGERLH